MIKVYQKNRGFTLIEVLLLIAVLSVLLAFKVKETQKEARNEIIQQTVIQFNTLLTVALNYYQNTESQGNASWPVNANDLDNQTILYNSSQFCSKWPKINNDGIDCGDFQSFTVDSNQTTTASYYSLQLTVADPEAALKIAHQLPSAAIQGNVITASVALPGATPTLDESTLLIKDIGIITFGSNDSLIYDSNGIWYDAIPKPACPSGWAAKHILFLKHFYKGGVRVDHSNYTECFYKSSVLPFNYSEGPSTQNDSAVSVNLSQTDFKAFYTLAQNDQHVGDNDGCIKNNGCLDFQNTCFPSDSSLTPKTYSESSPWSCSDNGLGSNGTVLPDGSLTYITYCEPPSYDFTDSSYYPNATPASDPSC